MTDVLTRPVADPLPFRATTDVDVFRRFLTRYASSVRVPYTSPSQLILTDRLVTEDVGRRYTWPALSSVCQAIVPGLASAVLALAGHRRSASHKCSVLQPSPDTAVAIFNRAVTGLSDRLDRLRLLVDDTPFDPDDQDTHAEGIIYQTFVGSHRRPLAQRMPAAVDRLLADAEAAGLSFVSGFALPGKAAVVLGGPPLTTLAGLTVRPAVHVRPHTGDSRCRWRPAVAVGGSVLIGPSEPDGRSRASRRLSWSEEALPVVDRVREALARTLPGLSAVPLPGSRPDVTGPAVVARLRALGVTRRMAEACADRLCYGRFGATPDAVLGDAVRLGADVRRSAEDLLSAAVASAESAGWGLVPAIVTLSRAGYAIAVGEVDPSFP